MKRLLATALMLMTSHAHAQSYGMPIPGLPKSVGPKTAAQSTSVTLATDQSPIPVTGSITATASSASVGLNGATAPTSSDLIGYINPQGKLQPFLGSSTGITVSANQGTIPWVISGGVAITSAAATTPVTQATIPWVISGGTAITNTPSVNQGTTPWVISGGVAITSSVSHPVTQGTIPWVISGGVAITSAASTPVTQGTNPWVISGGVAITTTVASSTITRPSNNTVNATILNANPTRQTVIIFNDSTTNCYIKFGATASTISYTIKLFQNDTYFMNPPIYTGRIDYLCDSATGSLEVNEQ